MQGSISLLVLNVVAAAALATGRFVTTAGAVPAAAARVLGVTRTSAAAAGDLVPVDAVGTAIVEAGAAVAVGAAVETDSVGRAITLAAGVKCGHALSAASAAGQFIEVLLIAN